MLLPPPPCVRPTLRPRCLNSSTQMTWPGCTDSHCCSRRPLLPADRVSMRTLEAVPVYAMASSFKLSKDRRPKPTPAWQPSEYGRSEHVRAAAEDPTSCVFAVSVARRREASREEIIAEGGVGGGGGVFVCRCWDEVCVGVGWCLFVCVLVCVGVCWDEVYEGGCVCVCVVIIVHLETKTFLCIYFCLKFRNLTI